MLSVKERSQPARIVPPLVFAALALAMLGAFAFAQKRKSEPLILDRVTFGFPGRPARNVFTPNGDGCADRGRILFRITSGDRGDVEIITRSGALIRTLARDRELPSYEPFEFRWDGRSDGGRLAPRGPYKLRIELTRQDRSLIPGGLLRLYDGPPLRACPRRPGG